MNISDILEWQWNGYSKYHNSHINLWVHIFTVPVFILGTFTLLISVFNFNVFSLFFSVIIMTTSIGIQGFGHSKEKLPAESFTGAKDALIRIFLEQLYTFPKFVISGKWYLALRNE
ncbi:hypothetical protein [Teredinibacter purpureus]|uniref:hypothetical protein n=1 Tax=Teredinibacter purpureus TaxID=2731756 RepID=UPI0005F80F43|nr:hypothetical protein [Teredinibacter purpureus]